MKDAAEFRFRGPGRYFLTAAGFLVCQDCGSLVMEGHRDAHDQFHEMLYIVWGVTQHG